MLKFIRRWYERRKLDKLVGELLETKDSAIILTNFLVWVKNTDLNLNANIDYSRRIPMVFENIEGLAKAIDITYFNIQYNKGDEYKIKEGEILLDDWLVDDDSYRVNVDTFLTRSLPRLAEIAKALEKVNSSSRNYHLGNSWAIYVTLQRLVEVTLPKDN